MAKYQKQMFDEGAEGVTAEEFLEAAGNDESMVALRELIRKTIAETMEAERAKQQEEQEQKPRLTKAQIMREKNRSKRLQLIRENMDLFR